MVDVARLVPSVTRTAVVLAARMLPLAVVRLFLLFLYLISQCSIGTASGCADPTTVECDGFDFCCPTGLACSLDANNEPLCGGEAEPSASGSAGTGTGATTSRATTSRATTPAATTSRATSTTARSTTASSSTSTPGGAAKNGAHAFVGVAGALIAGYALF